MTAPTLPKFRRHHRMRLLREEAKLTREFMAEQFHVSVNTIRNWEGGRSRPNWLALERWAHLVSERLEVPVTPEWLEWGDDEEPARSHGADQRSFDPVSDEQSVAA